MNTILHVGLPKTGSSALQMGLNKRKSELEQSDVLYWADSGDFKARQLQAFLEPKRPIKIRGQEFCAERLKKNFDEMKRQVEKRNPDYLILSSEEITSGFLDTNEEREGLVSLYNFLAQFSDNVSAVMYFRSPSSFYASYTQEVLKRGKDYTSPQDFYLPYRSIYENLEKVFDSVTLSDRPDPKADIVQEFLNLSGIAINYPVKRAVNGRGKPQNINATGSNEFIAACYWFHVQPGYFGQHFSWRVAEKLWRSLSVLDDKIPGKKKAHLSAKYDSLIKTRHDVEIDFVNERFSFHWEQTKKKIQESTDIDQGFTYLRQIFPINEKRFYVLRSAFVTHLLKQNN